MTNGFNMRFSAAMETTEPSRTSNAIAAKQPAVLKKAISWLLSQQEADGSWNAQIETNCCMEAQWLLALKFIGREHENVSGVIRYILNRQREDGSWDVYYGAEAGDINTTLECYYALRMYGYSIDDPIMAKAREWLLKNNWAKHIRVFTKYWLALFGEWPWEKTPALPPEIISLPKWVPFNIYHFASWARASMMPITVVSARKPVKVFEDCRLDELFPNGRGSDAVDYRVGKFDKKVFTWKNFFLMADKFLHAYGRLKKNPVREAAIKTSMEWILKHQDNDGVWGGIQPPWIYGIIAMHTEGFAHSQMNMSRALNAVDTHWANDHGRGIMVNATEGPVWDTMISADALLDAGETFGSCPALYKALDYLLEKEIRYYGDWAELNGREVEPSGWAFERANNFYPDIDDTGVALVTLKKMRRIISPHDERVKKIDAVMRRAVNWLLAMQSENGGWAAFDKDNTKSIVTKIPFCDFGEVLDPPSVDVTGHVIESLIYCGFTTDHPAVKKGLEYIYSEQEDDGSWFGRWGVNYIYGTYCVLRTLYAVGETQDMPHIKAATAWIASRQNADGGWGESCASYMEPALAGKGPSTPSQTAWAIISLDSFNKDGRFDSHIRKGIEYLEKVQAHDGQWDSPYYTGTGFPGYGLGAKVDLRNGAPLPQGKDLARGFMLRYVYYNQYFPIMAIGRVLNFEKR